MTTPRDDEGVRRVGPQERRPGVAVEYRLGIGGLVDNPIELDLSQLRDLAHDEQIAHGGAGLAVSPWATVSMTTILDMVKPSQRANWAMLYFLEQAAADHDPDACTIRQLGSRLTILGFDTSHGSRGHGIALLLANRVQPGVRLITSMTKIEFVRR